MCLKFSTCCGCMSLRTGSALIGAFGAVFYGIVAVITIMTITDKQMHVDIDVPYNTLLIAGIMHVVFALVHIILIIGAMEDCACLVIVWIAFSMLDIILQIMFFIIRASSYVTNKGYSDIMMQGMSLIACLACANVVLNYHRILLGY